MVFATTFSRTGRRASVFPAALHMQQPPRDTAIIRQHQDTAQAVMVEQDSTATTLRFDVPGVSREQLSIGIEGQVVRIASLEDAPRAYKAAFELPTDIEVATSTAKLENGVLTVHLVKQVPVSKVSQLAIN